MELPGLVTFRFDHAGGPVAALPCPGVGPGSVEEAYRHSALPLVLQALGGEVLHASAVLTARGVVAFCGASGSGKSTIAYGLHRRGHGLWADDAVALGVSEAVITTVRLPFDVRLRPASAALFGLGRRAARLVAGEAGRAVEPLVAVCVLDRGGPACGDVTVAPLRPSAALPAVLPHAYCFSLEDVARKRQMLRRYLALVARVPVLKVEFGGDIEGLAGVLAAIEQAVGEVG
jgi:hypothetical protein